LSRSGWLAATPSGLALRRSGELTLRVRVALLPTWARKPLAWLWLVEDGATVTDASGRPLDDRSAARLGAIGSQMSVVASAAGPARRHPHRARARDEPGQALERDGLVRAAVD
jgi:hypothetical protein